MTSRQADNRLLRLRWWWNAVALLLVTVGVGCTPLPVTPADEHAYAALEATRLQETVDYLANPALGGRMTGTRGNTRAGEYIAARMAAIGLEPAGEEGTFFQTFHMPQVRVAAAESALIVDGKVLRLGEDFDTMVAGSTGDFRGRLVFVGYGLTDDGHGDYDGVDVVGAVAMVLIGSPADDDAWDSRVEISRKLHIARQRGAVGALVVAPEYLGAVDVLEDVYMANRSREEIPAMRLSRAVADGLIARSGRFDSLEHVVRQIRTGQSPQSFALGVTASGTADTKRGAGRNVIGVLPATDASSEAPHIIVCTHYDHLSNWGDPRRQDVGWGVRPGADDNATGVAALLGLAEALAAMPTRYCDYVFIASSGEEYGFVGSSHYVKHPVKPLDDCPVMINVDQIGAVSGDQVYVVGSVMHGVIGGAVRQANDQVGMTLWPLPVAGIYWSDDAIFSDEGMETLFFYGGRNEDTYHQRADTPDTINITGVHRIGVLMFETIRRLDSAYGAADR